MFYNLQKNPYTTICQQLAFHGGIDRGVKLSHGLQTTTNTNFTHEDGLGFPLSTSLIFLSRYHPKLPSFL
jgi:hypothetical protein